MAGDDFDAALKDLSDANQAWHNAPRDVDRLPERGERASTSKTVARR